MRFVRGCNANRVILHLRCVYVCVVCQTQNPGGSSFARRFSPFLRRSFDAHHSDQKATPIDWSRDRSAFGSMLFDFARGQRKNENIYNADERRCARLRRPSYGEKEKKKKSKNAVQESVRERNWNARVRREGKRTILLKKNSARAYTRTKKVHRGSRDTIGELPSEMLEVLDEIGEVSLQLKVTGKRLAVDSPEISPSNLNWAKIDYYGGISVADYRTARS